MCVSSDFLEHDELSCNGLAVTPDHINEDDDRSSHASSSDWAPQPQIGNLHTLHLLQNPSLHCVLSACAYWLKTTRI